MHSVKYRARPGEIGLKSFGAFEKCETTEPLSSIIIDIYFIDRFGRVVLCCGKLTHHEN